MADACKCLTCQVEAMLTAEVARRGSLIESTEIVSLAVDLLASAMHGMNQEQRAFIALTTSVTLSTRLKMMDAAGAPQPTHQPEARVQ
ncbi:hypothetical protein ACO2RV_16945 [Ancylobacter sp. VNQ12]|uniref:hypothetical protein n=1 Tax=Ancylobacter sp. VNQ12 TaxID=3400920 RepID=UPI003C0936D4